MVACTKIKFNNSLPLRTGTNNYDGWIAKKDIALSIKVINLKTFRY